jgi:hypothetical protein
VNVSVDGFEPRALEQLGKFPFTAGIPPTVLQVGVLTCVLQLVHPPKLPAHPTGLSVPSIRPLGKFTITEQAPVAKFCVPPGQDCTLNAPETVAVTVGLNVAAAHRHWMFPLPSKPVTTPNVPQFLFAKLTPGPGGPCGPVGPCRPIGPMGPMRLAGRSGQWDQSGLGDQLDRRDQL